MNKEEALSLIKHLITELRDNEAILKANPKLMQDWVAKQKHLDEQVKKLNSCDMLWLDEKYGEWFRKEVKPHINPSLINSIKS